MQITLTNEEVELLVEVLGERRDSFLREISRAGSRDFKTLLRSKEELLENLLQKLRSDTTYPKPIRRAA